MKNRVIIIVLDSVGVGALPDAVNFGDVGSNTLANLAKAVGGVRLNNLEKMGLGNLAEIPGVNAQADCIASYGKMAEKSPGKDTTTGHWEIAGLILDKPFPVYPNGFPEEILKPFEQQIKRGILGNKAASGTLIIEELGEEHIRTGKPIIYTSADSVFQIAAHEEVIPVKELYQICLSARKLLTGEHAVGRVIARPFIGNPGSFERTANRRDFSLVPPGRTILDSIKDAGMSVKAVGKIEDIFAGRGITFAVHTKDNMDGVDQTIALIEEKSSGLIFTNLVDFDAKYGHRNNPAGYARAMEEFDLRIPEIKGLLREEDILIITADHGCDPTTSSTDHSREYVPLLVYGRRIKEGRNLGIRETFADIAATIAEYLEVEQPVHGTSILKELLK